MSFVRNINGRLSERSLGGRPGEKATFTSFNSFGWACVTATWLCGQGEYWRTTVYFATRDNCIHVKAQRKSHTCRPPVRLPMSLWQSL